MSRARSNTAALIREGHSVSLKVLRLSRPSFAQQHPLPNENTAGIPREASLAFPSATTDQDFILSTNLSLPPAFGAAYVGEVFSCSLCANNELSSPNSNGKSVSNIRIGAEMQTPSHTVPLQLYSSEDSVQQSEQSEPGSSIQHIVRFDLKEEGNHVLAVNVSYSDNLHVPGGPAESGSRVRTFRKLYQFLAQPCLSVRTKATELVPNEIPDKSLGPYGRATLVRYALEAQLENVSESRIVLEQTVLKPVSPFKSTSLNWDFGVESKALDEETALNPRDVMQIAFLVEQQPGVTAGLEELKASLKKDGRAVLGQVSISWRGNMGEHGSLSTGNLMTRRKQ